MDKKSRKRLKMDGTGQNSINATKYDFKADDIVARVLPHEVWASNVVISEIVKVFRLTVEEFCDLPLQTLKTFTNPEKFDAESFVDRFNEGRVSLVTGLDQPISHEKDVDLLESEVRQVMRWHEDTSEQEKHIAPILPVVQSSGTGKTKLLYELRQRFNRKGVHCVSILCLGASESPPHNWKRYYDGYHQCDLSDTHSKGRDKLRAKVIEVCLKGVSENNKKMAPNSGSNDLFDVVLLLDEAQHLLVCEPPGFLFRVVRWMSREIPLVRPDNEGMFRNVKLTVVPTGTSLALADDYPEAPRKVTGGRYLPSNNLNYLNGDKPNAVPYDPFNWLRTMGCLATQTGDDPISQRDTEYERCIPYGRPLFQILYQKNLLDQFERTALDKVLVGKDIDNDKNKASIISVLGTRVQMGTTNSAVVSELVSRGYAHLTGFRRQKGGAPYTASFAFLPDPVCARLAMRLMDDEAQLERAQHVTPVTGQAGYNFQLKGKKKSWWVGKISEIYRSELCRFDKGNFGEVTVALFLLFCGDELRKVHNDEYKTFSVTFTDWLALLNKLATGVTDEAMADETSPAGTCTINCIQFYRHSLRIDFKKYHSQQFLGWLYNAACGIYGPVNVTAFDQLLPIKYVADTQTEYLPCFVSTKNYAYAAPSSARGWQIASIGALVEAGVTCGLFLLVIVGQDTISKGYENVLGEDGTNNLDMFQISKPKKESAKAKQVRMARNEYLKEILSDDVTKVHSHLVPKMLCIGENDEFEIHKAIKNAHPSNDKLSDVYECHSSFLSDNGDIYTNVSGLPNDAVDFMNATRGALHKR